MKSIIKSCLNTRDNEKIEVLEMLLSAEDCVTEREAEYIDYIIKSYTDLEMTPTMGILLQKYPELENAMTTAKDMDSADMEFYSRQLIRSRKAKKASLSIMDIASKIESKGLEEMDIEALREYMDDEVQGVNKRAYDFSYFAGDYVEDKNKPTGLVSGISQIDEIIGGMNYGTLNTIMAFTSQFKSTMGVNVCYHNSYNLGYNVAIISLEVTRKEMLYNILGRHSNKAEFDKFPFISHGDIRKHNLPPEKEEYLLKTILPDYTKNSKGQLFILDETDFKNMSYNEIRQTLYQCDDICMEKTGTGLDAIMVDHCHLLKFNDNANSRGKTEASVVNDYISFFRRLTLKFRKTEKLDENGNPVYRQLSTILLAQSNRTGYENAVKNRGKYSLTAIAEFNEIERASYRIFSIFADDELKESKEALMCILKNRGGATRYDPMAVYADGEAYVFGDCEESNTGNPNTIDNIMSNDFNDFFSDDDFGFLN